MSEARCSEEEFIALFKTHGANDTAKILNLHVRKVYERRQAVELRRGIKLESPNQKLSPIKTNRIVRAAQRLHKTVKDGIVLVASDAHYWPGPASCAHRALVQFCKDLKPKILIMNGDIMDGAQISRHARIGWDRTPTVIEEIETCKERLDELRRACPKAMHMWPLGNHDARFETRIANIVPQYEGVMGMALHDHFPGWEPCWSVWINEEVVVKHRFKGGLHSSLQNPLWSGKTMVTGHLHRLMARPLSDYNGTRWGVETGTLMDSYDDQTADYTEDGPANWQSGFIKLTFKNSKLMWPEIVHVLDDDHVEFQGEIIKV